MSGLPRLVAGFVSSAGQWSTRSPLGAHRSPSAPARPLATVTRGRFEEGVVTAMRQCYAQRIDVGTYREKAEQAPVKKACPDRRGARQPEGRGGVTVAGPAAVDAARLVQVLCRSMDLGNTVLVIEHDPDAIRAVDRNPRRNLSR
ncbi:hypothetical protein AB0D83_14890 [Streptomyces decoyicus]|uniref:hypothetical protein n=1 Tax=Streptomyces decoyicus TaxID=249567 RepID=UPI0033E5301D